MRPIQRVPKDGILSPGQAVGGVEILHMLNLSERLYAVRHLCCGKEDELTSRQIHTRVANHSHLCTTCGRSIGGTIGGRISKRRPHATAV